jgi:PAS domain S-box-containing protein
VEEELRAGEQRLEAIVSSLTDHMSVVDEQHNIVWANDVARRLFGADLIGRKCYTAYHRRDTVCEPCLVRDTFADGRIHEDETEVVAADGKKMAFWCTANVAARHEDGRPKLVLEISRNVTDRRRAEEVQARLVAIIKQAAENIVVFDLEGRIEYLNPAFERATGYIFEKLVGRNARVLLADNEAETLIEEIEETLSRGESWSGRIRTKRMDGSVFEHEVSISPIRDSSGSVISFVSVGRDVTEQLALEMQLRQAQKLESIGRLAAGIAHEINTPMQYVGDNTRFLEETFRDVVKLLEGGAELLAEAKRGNTTEELIKRVEAALEETDIGYLSEEIPKAIEQSLEGIERVTEIVRAMKEFSHPGVEDKVALDINRAIASTVTVSRNEWKYVAELETDLDPSLSAVLCYPGEFNQVMLNLITNAAQAGDWVEIRVSDTGTGIPENIRERVFDPFFTTKEVGRGTGQGLTIAHSVIKERHAGSISFETEMGSGTTFIIRLPICPESEEEESREESGLADKGVGNGGEKENPVRG